MVVAEKKNTWAKSCKESAKRETEIFKMMGCLADHAKEGGGDGNTIKKILMQLCDEEKEEYEACARLEAMQKNVNEAHTRASETAQRLFEEIEEYMRSLDRESERPLNISDKNWQMMQSNDTKLENFDKDFAEIREKAQQTGWNENLKTSKIWAQRNHDDSP